MDPDDYIIDITTTDTIDLSSISTSTVTIDSGASDYNIDWSTLGISITPENRHDVRDEGKIPIDIWAKMFNNGKIEDD
jgi:hypothetical protein